MRKMTFVQGCLAYFGKREGQTAMDFKKEIDALTPEDRAYLSSLFPTVGIEIVTATG